MKKTFAVLCAALVAALMFALPTGVLAAELTGECGDNLTYSFDTETCVLTISGTGAMTDFANQNASPFAKTSQNPIKTSCTAVVIEEGVTTIGSYAFYNMQYISSLSLPSTLTEIHANAFYGLKALTSCVLPDSVTLIGANAFAGCNAMQTIHLPESLETIGQAAFSSCQALQEITLPSGLTSMGNNAFYSCRNLTEVVIPDSLTVLPDGCFNQCWNVASFTLPETVTTLGQYVLSSSSITEIDIPASVTSMLFDSFGWGESNMVAFNVDEANPNYCDVDGVLYTKDRTELMRCPMGVTGEFNIDPACKVVGPSALDGCFYITAINIPEGVETISSGAFSSTGITSIVIPSTVTSFSSPLGFCENLVTVEIYGDLDELGVGALRGLPALETVILGPNVRGYGESCFAESYALRSVTPIEGLTRIDESCFDSCQSLTDFHIPETVTYIGGNAFYKCSSLEGLYIPEGVTYLGMRAFAYTPITEATIPETITEIPGMLFQYCQQLTTVTVLGDLSASTAYQVIGSNAFYNCTALEKVYFTTHMPDPQKIAKNALSGTNSKTLEIHYLNIYPEWGEECPFDSANTGYIYVCDELFSQVYSGWVELRERAVEDGRRDMRFVFVQVNLEGSTVNSRWFKIVNDDTGKELTVPCRRTFYVDPDGEYEYFTLVVTDITPKNFDTYLVAYAYMDVTACDGSLRRVADNIFEPLYCCVNDLLGQD